MKALAEAIPTASKSSAESLRCAGSWPCDVGVRLAIGTGGRPIPCGHALAMPLAALEGAVAAERWFRARQAPFVRPSAGWGACRQRARQALDRPGPPPAGPAPYLYRASPPP